MRTARSTVLSFCGAIAISLALAASAGAATVTIGSPLQSSFTTTPAGRTGTSAMVAGPNVAAPVDGTVINWHTEGFSGTFRVRVIRLGPGTTAVATASGPFTPVSAGSVDSPLSLPIKQGEVIGFDNTSGSDMAKLAAPSSTYSSAGWQPALQDNGPPQSPSDLLSVEFAENATIRYCVVPKVKGKKLGVAKKVLANAACSLGRVKKKKGQKGAKVVRSQSVVPGTSLGDGAAVNVKARVKPKK